MKFTSNKKKDKSDGKERSKILEPKFAPTIELKGYNTADKESKTDEFEVVERVIYPEKIICPDCGGLTLDGLDFCDRCGGEIHDIWEQS